MIDSEYTIENGNEQGRRLKKCDESYCLVLSGGGAKGVYHIGAWKALKELGISVDAFVGNSIGAIIAGFLAQGADEELERIGRDIGLDFILAMPRELVKDGEFRLDEGSFKAFMEFNLSVLSRKSLDTSPLRRHLTEYLDESKIRSGGKDLGLVTINATDMKPVEIFIDDMPEGTLLDYLLASSAFPGFDSPVIGGKKYVDGGLFNNIPCSMAQRRGYRNIIVIDISGVGIKHKLEIEGYRIVYIKNSIDMGGALDFNRDFLDRYSMLGYLDTMRTFGRLGGYYYFFEQDGALEDRWKRRFLVKLASGDLADPLGTVSDGGDADAGTLVRRVFPDYARFDRRWLMVFADCAALCLGLERIRSWTYPDVMVAIIAAVRVVEKDLENLAADGVGELRRILVQEIKDRTSHRLPYYQYLFVSRHLTGKSRSLTTRLLFRLNPELAAAILFIAALNIPEER